eukprot:scaffold284_cov133-Skeletonema_menzelii.AAC.18
MKSLYDIPWVTFIILSLLLLLPSCSGHTEAQYAASLANITAYNQLRREEDVFIRSRMIGEHFVHEIRNIAALARALLSDHVVQNHDISHSSLVSVLVTNIINLGGVIATSSETFGVTNNHEINRIYMNPDSVIAIFVPNLHQLDDVAAIRALRVQTSSSRNNLNYRIANTPAFYIGNSGRLSARGVWRIVGGNGQRLCREMRASFTGAPVERTCTRGTRTYTITYRLP